LLEFLKPTIYVVLEVAREFEGETTVENCYATL